MSIAIKPANLDAPDFIALIETHAALMLSQSPAGSCHFLPIDGLKTPDVTVWALYLDDELIGCGALKQISTTHGELKSMHTLAAHRGKGLGRTMLEHVLETAKARRYTRISLETGSMDAFAPSRALYTAHGFTQCPPFEDYTDDPNSFFMTRML